MTTRDPLTYGWWLASRSAGVVAYLLLSAAVLAGLAMALRLGSARTRAGLRATHERVALLALGATAAHGLLLLPDPWLKPGLTGLIVPFAMPYRPVWTGLGLLGGYLAAALSLTYYARRRLGIRRWRLAHRFIPIAWALAAIHVIGAGTDANSLWLDVPVALTISLVVTLLGQRLLTPRPGAARPARAPIRALAAPEPVPEAPLEPIAAPLWSRAREETVTYRRSSSG
ncbi:MAG: methionine sulfoxide reductase heme-binding subunit [Solirubrobacteraceae bacterium]|nr:methionine sulfoxide reductase heme-binding subunit [Solirubrobacteraceae bacterium]